MPETITTIEDFKAAAEEALAPLNDLFEANDVHVMEPDTDLPMTPSGWQLKKRILESSSAIRAGMVAVSTYSEVPSAAAQPGGPAHELDEITLSPASGSWRVVGIMRASAGGGLFPNPETAPKRGDILGASQVIEAIEDHVERWQGTLS